MTTRLVTSGVVRTRSTTPTGGRLLPSQESKLDCKRLQSPDVSRDFHATGNARRTLTRRRLLSPASALAEMICPVVGRHRQSSSALTRCRTGHNSIGDCGFQPTRRTGSYGQSPGRSGRSPIRNHQTVQRSLRAHLLRESNPLRPVGSPLRSSRHRELVGAARRVILARCYRTRPATDNP